MAERFPAAVLFDLDGTLLDRAPDFFATLAVMAERRGWEAPADARIRPVVSKGSRAMLGVAFPDVGATERDALIPEFLQRYEALIGQHARLFDGIAEMLEAQRRGPADKPRELGRTVAFDLLAKGAAAIIETSRPA